MKKQTLEENINTFLDSFDAVFFGNPVLVYQKAVDLYFDQRFDDALELQSKGHTNNRYRPSVSLEAMIYFAKGDYQTSLHKFKEIMFYDTDDTSIETYYAVLSLVLLHEHKNKNPFVYLNLIHKSGSYVSYIPFEGMENKIYEADFLVNRAHAKNSISKKIGKRDVTNFSKLTSIVKEEFKDFSAVQSFMAYSFSKGILSLHRQDGDKNFCLSTALNSDDYLLNEESVKTVLEISDMLISAAYASNKRDFAKTWLDVFFNNKSLRSLARNINNENYKRLMYTRKTLNKRYAFSNSEKTVREEPPPIDPNKKDFVYSTGEFTGRALGVLWYLGVPGSSLVANAVWYRPWMLDIARDNYEKISTGLKGVEWLFSPMQNGFIEGGLTGLSMGLSVALFTSILPKEKNESKNIWGIPLYLLNTFLSGSICGIVGGLIGGPEGLMWGAYIGGIGLTIRSFLD